MANRVQVELGAKVQGFVDGMNQASESAKQYETDTRKVKDSLGNFRKEMAQAKRDVQNLAAAYAKLDATARASQFGQEMKKQLDAAKEAAAQYVDMQGDLNTELKNLASDTRVLDTLAEGMGVVGDITSSTLGIIAQFTGNEEDARRAIVAFTTAQSAVGTVTKIANALQAQSNTMLAIAAVQNKAAAAAASIKAAAEGKGAVATKAATVAQAAFNKVAMANPYVLLAMAVLGVVSALGTFIVWSKKAEAQEKAEAKAAEKAKSIKEAYYNSYNQKLVDTMSSYTKLQQEWRSLKSESEKNQWIKDNKDAFHELGYEINNTAEAEKFFVDNEAAVIASFTARAEAAAYAAQQVEVFNQALKDTPKAGEKISVKEAAKYGISEKGHKVDTHWFDDNEIEVTKADEKKIREIRLQEARTTADKLGKERIAAEKKANEAAAKTGAKQYSKTREAELKKADKKAPKTKVEIEIEKGSLQESQDKLKKLEEIRAKMSIDNPDLPKIQREIEKVKKDIEEKKIKLGLEKPKTNIDFLSEYEKKLSDAVKAAESDYMTAYLKGQKKGLDELWLAWAAAIDQKEKYEANKKIQSPNGGIESTGNERLLPALKGAMEAIETYNKRLDELNKAKVDLDNIYGIDEINLKLKTFEDRVASLKKKQKELNDLKLTISDPKKLKEVEGEIGKCVAAIDLYGEKIEELNAKKFEHAKEIVYINKELERTYQLLQNVVQEANKVNPHSMRGLSNDISTLQEKLESTDWKAMGEEGEAAMHKYVDRIVEMKTELEAISEIFSDKLLTPQERLIKKADKLADKYNLVADAVASVGDMFSALSQLAEDDPALEVMGIVAQAVANMFAGYAQATVAAAQTGNPWVWAAFAAAGLAQTLAMVAQIKSAAQFAEGGIVGGSSYSGDRINARLNSGEMVLNKRQQKNLFDLLDMDVMPQKGGTNVTVTGVVRGTDLILVQKNTNKIRSKSGTQLTF
jgi:hypothetical protein